VRPTRSPRLGQFRIHARRAVRLQALVTHVDMGWQARARVVDLGLGGAGITIEAGIKVGDVVTLSFTAPTLWDPLLIRARVAWARPFTEPGAMSAGVAFEQKGPTAALALFDLVGASTFE
jgi:hypothetical protein